MSLREPEQQVSGWGMKAGDTGNLFYLLMVWVCPVQIFKTISKTMYN